MTVDLEKVPKRILDRLPSVDAMGIRTLAGRIEEKASIEDLADGKLPVSADAVVIQRGNLNTALENDLSAITSLDTRLYAVEAGQISGVIGRETRAILDADLNHPDGTIGWVNEDPTPDNNSFYRKSGAPNAGSWIRTSGDRISIVESKVAGLEPAKALKEGLRSDLLLAVVDSNNRILQKFALDGTMFAKLAVNVGVANGLQFTPQPDGSYSLSLGTVEGELPIPSALLKTSISMSDDLLAFIDVNGRVLMRITADGTIKGKFEVSLTEIIAARGSRSTLTERLDQSLTSYGLLREPIAGEWFLRETRQRLRLRARGETVQLVIAMIGDSWTHNAARYSGGMATMLQAAYGDAGAGWTGLAWGSGGGGLPNGNAQTSIVGYTPDATNWTVAYTSALSPDIGSITSSTAGAKQTITGPASCSAVVLYYLGTADNVLRYRWNGGSWTTPTLSNTATLQTLALSSVPAGAWTLELEVVSGTCTWYGLDVQKSADGVRVHKLGATGSQAAQWAAVGASGWQAGITALTPNLVMILHGTNDQGASRAPSLYRADIQTLITRVRAAVPSADILLIAPCENQRTNSVAMADYAIQLRELAAINSTAFLDLQPFFGLQPADYAAGSSRPWFNVDTIHPEPASGGRAIQDALMRLLTTR